MNTSKWAIAAACAAIFSTTAAAGPNDVMLSHYESLERLDLRSIAAQAANGEQESVMAAPLVMSFDAMGQSFDLELEANDRLMRAARQNPLLDGVTIYRGEIAGRPGSWARIVVADGVPQGMFWDGQEMYAIEAPGDSIVATDAPIIFRLADAQIAPGSMSCGSTSMSMTSAAAALDGLVDELGPISQAPGAISEIEMGAVGDFEFTSNKGGDAAAATAITNRLNMVDGIFSQQLGIQITLTTIDTFSDSNDPFTQSDASLLLDELSNYRSITPSQNSNGLTHLYTGRDLDGSTVGIAWSSMSTPLSVALCSNFFGAGLSEGNSNPTFDSLVAAHEIGHNFGAPHDGQAGSACESETGAFIMAPQLNGSEQFSACSIAEMSAVIPNAACITLLPAVDMTVALTSAPSVLFGASDNLTYDVSSVGTLDATNVAVDFTIPANVTLGAVTPSAGTCTSGAGTVSCTIGDVPGQSTRTVDIAVTPVSLGAGALSASVTADVDERPANNQESLQLTVVPAVDLVASSPTGASIRVDQTATINASLENRATMDATGVTLTVNLGNALQATSATWSLGTCTIALRQVDCVATTFAAGASSTVSVSATGVSAGNPNITVSLASAEADLVPGDNSSTGRLEVKEPKDEDSGGSTGPLFLLLMSLTALLRRRR
jgi:hypothetical protein